MPPKQPLHVDEDSRVSLSLKLLWGILAGVAFGAFWAAGVFFQTSQIKETAIAIRADMQDVKRQLQDHERRLIKIEAKTGIATSRNENADGWTE